MDEHRDFFRGLGIPYCTVRTDENPWQALALFLHERKRFS